MININWASCVFVIVMVLFVGTLYWGLEAESRTTAMDSISNEIPNESTVVIETPPDFGMKEIPMKTVVIGDYVANVTFVWHKSKEVIMFREHTGGYRLYDLFVLTINGCPIGVDGTATYNVLHSEHKYLCEDGITRVGFIYGNMTESIEGSHYTRKEYPCLEWHESAGNKLVRLCVDRAEFAEVFEKEI